MIIYELDQLEERYKALSQECEQRSLELRQLKAAPEEQRDNSLIKRKVAEYGQKAVELTQLLKQVIAGRDEVANNGVWGLTGALGRKAMFSHKQLLHGFLKSWPVCCAGREPLLQGVPDTGQASSPACATSWVSASTRLCNSAVNCSQPVIPDA
jgi:hypothetical protein